MRNPKDPTLKDMEISVLEGAIESTRGELSKRDEREADRLLNCRKPMDPDETRTVSGGRPESNRRKF